MPFARWVFTNLNVLIRMLPMADFPLTSIIILSDQDGTPMPDSYPTTPSSTDAATSESKETLGTLQPSQQQPALPTPPALGEIPQELQSPAEEVGNSAQLLMPIELEELGPTRTSGEAETTQMELSPAPTISK